MHVIKSVGVLSVAKIMGLTYGCMGLLAAPIFLLFGLIGSLAGQDKTPFAGIFGVVLAILMPILYGVLGFIFGAIGAANIIVDMIIQNVSQGDLTDLSFTIPRADLPKAVDLANRIAKDIGAKSVEVKEEIAKVSLVGVGMRSHSGVAARMFETLAREGINIMMISTSEIKISCVIEEKAMDAAIRALHRAFGLEKS